MRISTRPAGKALRVLGVAVFALSGAIAVAQAAVANFAGGDGSNMPEPTALLLLGMGLAGLGVAGAASTLEAHMYRQPRVRDTVLPIEKVRATMQISTRHDPFPVKKPYHGIYAHGVETRAGARVLHVSGQVGESPEGFLPSDFRGQCRQAIANLETVLIEADMELDDIVKLTFFIIRRGDMETLVDVRKELLDGVRPAITTVYVAGLVSSDWLVEVEAVACAA